MVTNHLSKATFAQVWQEVEKNSTAKAEAECAKLGLAFHNPMNALAFWAAFEGYDTARNDLDMPAMKDCAFLCLTTLIDDANERSRFEWQQQLQQDYTGEER